MAVENGCGLCRIQVNHIGVKKDGETLLSDVSFEMHCGELTALIGVNGAGKTTLLRSMLGEIRHEGSVSFESHDGKKLDAVTVGYVPQRLDFDRDAPVSVEDFLLLGRTRSPICFFRDKKAAASLDDVLAAVDCTALRKRKLGALSGGELQRVLLANALFPLPELLILDEPVSGVDAHGSEVFYGAVADLKKHYHMAIAMVTHDLGTVQAFADNVVLINRRVLKVGTPAEVFASEEFGQTFYRLPGREAGA
ncbi:MAG: metal ABC transporter ATP-binding protein [Clostridia bacterium]|nr:metal ABC transporter ATP-binding protein [Clostridia bacterium]